MPTIKQYLQDRGLDYENAKYRQVLGNIMVLVSETHGKPIEKVDDQEFGSVNSYAVELLDDVVSKLKTRESALPIVRAMMASARQHHP